MEISVIIPSFNRAHTLSRALDSVLEQSCMPAEIIVVDDASADHTESLVQTYGGRVQYIKLPLNRGVSHARNIGIQRARGEWVALLDSDDSWLPEKLARQQALVKDDSTVRAVHTDEIWIRNGRRVNPKHRHKKPQGWVYPDCLPLCCVSPSSVLLHRSVFDVCGLFDESLPACEDYDLWLRIFSRYPLSLVDAALVTKYGGHDDQLSRQYWGMDRFRVEALARMLEQQQLDPQHRDLTRNMLVDKCNILINGAEKRGNDALVKSCQALMDRYTLAQVL